jgi:predicted DsbA family dithiol-disulfide isomerase
VRTAHRLAMENQNIKADMVDAALFPYLVQKYGVSGVPHIVVNETQVMVGAQPIEKFLDAIEKA